MGVDCSRLKAAANAALCAAALSLAALGRGCAPGPFAPASAEAATPSPAPVVASPPAQNTRPAPSPAVETPLPTPEGFVNDFANVIDDKTERLLEARLTLLKARAQIEFAVVTVETTGAQDIFDYSLALAKRWGVGPPEDKPGGGLLLLLAVEDHKWCLQVSDRLLADLPDDLTGEIGKVMTPSLRAGRYGEAVNVYADGLIKRLAKRRGFSMTGEELNLQPSPEEKPKTTRRKP